MEFVREVLSQYQYNGFDAEAFRLKIVKEWSTREILAALALYVQVGNKPSGPKANKRKGKVDEAERVKLKLTSEITLARLAIAFQGMTRDIRQMGIETKTVNARFSDLPDPHLQDPSLIVFMDRSRGLEFNKRFSEALQMGSRRANASDNTVTDWWTIAYNGSTDAMRTGINGNVHSRGSPLK